jgi:GT2 family glycosyltransferase
MRDQRAADRTPAVVIATRNRKGALVSTLYHLLTLPERPEIIVVDNGSDDGTPETVRPLFPSVRMIALDVNLGGAARTLGVTHASSDTVAFCDDDSVWEPGALTGAARLFAEYPKLGLVAAQVLLGDERRPDPACQEMERSPLARTLGIPYPSVLGFIACGGVVRRCAYLQAGGFHPRFGIGGEEELLALDLAAYGWNLHYVPELVARHFPSPVRDVTRRRQTVTRNALWVSWLRGTPREVASRTSRAIQGARNDQAVQIGLQSACLGLPWVLKQRKRLPRRVEAARRLLQTA